MSLRAATPPVRAPRSRKAMALSLAVVALVALGAWIAYREWRDRPPFPASAVDATATVRFTEWSRFGQDARAIGAPDLGVRPGGPVSNRLFVGKLDLRTPPEAGDAHFYHVIVVDKHHDQLTTLGNVGSRPDYLVELSKRYPWLSALARKGDDESPSVVEVSATQPGPITFAGSVPNGQQLSESDLMVVLVLLRGDGTVYWAERVTG